KADVRQTTAALSDVADTVLNQVVELVEPEVRAKWGSPQACDPTPDPLPQGERGLSAPPSLPGKGVGGLGSSLCRYALLGLGKLGGREISYHSDLDLLLVYEADGSTDRGEPNSQFFTELAQRVGNTLSRYGPMGRLYAVDMRLRPTGESGALVIPPAACR